MGLNTVAVLMNDCVHELENDDGTISKRMAFAMTHHSRTTGNDGYFCAGRVISCSHADDQQIVIVAGNTGFDLSDADPETWKKLSYFSLSRMADALKKHGWSAKPPKNLKQAKRSGK